MYAKHGDTTIKTLVTGGADVDESMYMIIIRDTIYMIEKCCSEVGNFLLFLKHVHDLVNHRRFYRCLFPGPNKLSPNVWSQQKMHNRCKVMFFFFVLMMSPVSKKVLKGSVCSADCLLVPLLKVYFAAWHCLVSLYRFQQCKAQSKPVDIRGQLLTSSGHCYSSSVGCESSTHWFWKRVHLASTLIRVTLSRWFSSDNRLAISH